MKQIGSLLLLLALLLSAAAAFQKRNTNPAHFSTLRWRFPCIPPSIYPTSARRRKATADWIPSTWRTKRVKPDLRKGWVTADE